MVALVTFSIVACGTVRVETYNHPTVAPGWRLTGDVDVAYELAIPSEWMTFDLQNQLDLAVTSCASSGLQSFRRQGLMTLVARGVRLFGCDLTRAAEVRLPVGYAIRGAAPAVSLDAYLESLTQEEGRVLISRRHVAVNAGDMVVQRIREQSKSPDGSIIDTAQFQFFIIRFGALHVFTIEYPTAAGDDYQRIADMIGTSLTPLR